MKRRKRPAQPSYRERPFWREFERAKKGLCATRLSQAKWLIHFSRPDARLLPEEEQFSLRVWLLVFAKFTTMPGRHEALTIGEEDLPSLDQLAQANVRLQGIFRDLQKDGEADVLARQWHGVLRLKGKQVVSEVLIQGLDLLDAFALRVSETLAGLTRSKAFLPPCAVCKRLFVAKRRDATLCSASCRTIQWRRAHPEEFRRMRQEAYGRKLEAVGRGVAERYRKAKGEVAKREGDRGR